MLKQRKTENVEYFAPPSSAPPHDFFIHLLPLGVLFANVHCVISCWSGSRPLALVHDQ